MAIFRHTLIVFIIALSCMNHANADTHQQDYYRSFWNPTYHGQRVDYCAPGKKDCGEKIANRYCQIMGYNKADQQIIAYNVGLTHYIDTKVRCQGWTCSGFKLIHCVKKMIHQPPKAYYYRSQAFVFPRYNHYRVDWCYENRLGCGHRAAFSFCRRMGFSRAQGYEQQKHVLATRAIGDQKLCFGQECTGFSRITCYR